MIGFPSFLHGAAACARPERDGARTGHPLATRLLVALLLNAAAPVRIGAADLMPDQLVNKVLAEVLVAVAQAQTGKKTREQALEVARQKILPHIDFERMTRLAVGRAWRDANTTQRQRVVGEFSSFIIRIYSFAVDTYQGQEVIVEPLRRNSGDRDVTVGTRFEKSGTRPVQVDYVMWKSPDGWKVYDIVVENVSLVITYRSQFGEEIQRGGIDGLTQTLREKNREAQSVP